MTEGESPKRYDLEDRTFRFAKRVRVFVKMLPRTETNIDDIRQLGRASGSVGANYIEANDALSKKDFLLKIKIARREAKESRYFLRLLEIGTNPDAETERNWLVGEATELMRIPGAILRNSE